MLSFLYGTNSLKVIFTLKWITWRETLILLRHITLCTLSSFRFKKNVQQLFTKVEVVSGRYLLSHKTIMRIHVSTASHWLRWIVVLVYTKTLWTYNNKLFSLIYSCNNYDIFRDKSWAYCSEVNNDGFVHFESPISMPLQHYLLF